MTGLEKITKKIYDDSDVICKSIIENAELEKKKILEDAEKEAKTAYDRIIADAENKVQNDDALALSGVNMTSGRTLLAAKNDAINYAIEATLKTMKKLPEEEYLDLIGKLIEKNVQSGKGVLYFGENDLNRLPKDFSKRINVSLKNAEITVSDTTKDISDGFILVYGDIEINCTFEAMIHSEIDVIKEIICKIIF